MAAPVGVLQDPDLRWVLSRHLAREGRAVVRRTVVNEEELPPVLCLGENTVDGLAKETVNAHSWDPNAGTVARPAVGSASYRMWASSGS